MGLSVRIGAGTGVESLVAAAAVADADWRSVFTHGETAWSAARSAGGAALTGQVGRFGRFGWINLVGLLTARRPPWSHAVLLDLLASATAEDLHATLVGVRRHELRQHVDEATLRRALTGDRDAGRRTRAALEQTVVQVSPWLLRTPSATVRQVCLDTVAALPAPAGRAPASAATRARQAAVGDEVLIEEVAPGVHYGPAVLEDVVLVTSVQVAPILVVVDEVDRTVILHPPLGAAGATDAAPSCGTWAGRSATPPGSGSCRSCAPADAPWATCAPPSTARAPPCCTTWPCSAPPGSSRSRSWRPRPTCTPCASTASRPWRRRPGRSRCAPEAVEKSRHQSGRTLASGHAATPGAPADRRGGRARRVRRRKRRGGARERAVAGDHHRARF